MTKTKYNVLFTTKFKKSLKKVKKQSKNIEELLDIIDKLVTKEELDVKYKNHKLINDGTYHNCFECHIKPDWLLIYKYEEDNLILVMVDTGSHSYLFGK